MNWRASLLRWSISLGLLLGLIIWLQPDTVLAELHGLDPGWLLIALAVSLVQTTLSAWRWRFTAHRLGLKLGWRRALADYYLAGFINQLLPGGVLGDALRAQRHARVSGRLGPAWRAVIIERTSGQFVVVASSLLLVQAIPAWRERVIDWGQSGSGMTALVLMLTAAALVLLASAAMRYRHPAWRVFLADIRVSLLAPAALQYQLPVSLAIVFSYALMFALTGLAVGVDPSFGLLLAIALPVLLAMLIPLSVAGWGLREAAAAAVWLSLGWAPGQGVAVAIAYGLVVFIAALPGAMVLALRPRA